MQSFILLSDELLNLRTFRWERCWKNKYGPAEKLPSKVNLIALERHCWVIMSRQVKSGLTIYAENRLDFLNDVSFNPFHRNGLFLLLITTQRRKSFFKFFIKKWDRSSHKSRIYQFQQKKSSNNFNQNVLRLVLCSNWWSCLMIQKYGFISDGYYGMAKLNRSC